MPIGSKTVSGLFCKASGFLIDSNSDSNNPKYLKTNKIPASIIIPTTRKRLRFTLSLLLLIKFPTYQQTEVENNSINPYSAL